MEESQEDTNYFELEVLGTRKYSRVRGGWERERKRERERKGRGEGGRKEEETEK